MVRSLEKKPLPAVLSTLMRCHCIWSLYTSSILSCTREPQRLSSGGAHVDAPGGGGLGGGRHIAPTPRRRAGKASRALHLMRTALSASA